MLNSSARDGALPLVLECEGDLKQHLMPQLAWGCSKIGSRKYGTYGA